MFNFLLFNTSTPRVTRSKLMCLCAAAGLIPCFTFAQSDSISQAMRAEQLAEVVVQSTRTNAKSPIPHSNFSAESLAKQYHAQDIPYLLSAVPSLVETSDGGTGTGYTGLRIRGSDPTRTNVTLNGIPLNDAESQGVFWVNLPDLASSASEIQVQRGVGTSTNGAGAFGASVNLNLSKVEPDRFATITNTIGSFGTRKHALQVGTGLIDQKIAFTARISGIYADGYVDRASVDLNAIHLSAAYLDEKQTAQVHLLSGHEITYQAWNGLPAQYYDKDTLRTFNTAGTEKPGDPYSDEVDNYTQRHFLAHYKRVLRPDLQLQLNGHYTKGFGFFEQYKAQQSLFDYGLPIGLIIDTVLPPTDLVRRRWLDNDFYGGTFALRWSPTHPWTPTFLLGGALNQYKGSHFGEVIWTEASAGGGSQGHRYYDNAAKKVDANLFLKAEVAPSQAFAGFLDLQIRSVRYDFLGFNQTLENVQQNAQLGFFNPKIGATYSWSTRWSTYAFAGIGHREPNRDDYTQSTPSSRPRAEKMLDIETGLRGGGKGWSTTANFFWMKYKDQLVLDGRINDVGAYIRTNVPDSWRTGLELEANATLGKRFRVAGNATYSQNQIREFVEFRDNWDTGEQAQIVHKNPKLAFSPEFITRVEATVFGQSEKRQYTTGLDQATPQRRTKRLEYSATLIGKYVSQQFLDNTSNTSTSLPGYLVADLRLNCDLFQVFGKQTSIILSIQNLFGKKYASNGWAYRYISGSYDARPDNAYTRLEGDNVYHQAGYFPQAGRNWMATLRLAF